MTIGSAILWYIVVWVVYFLVANAYLWLFKKKITKGQLFTSIVYGAVWPLTAAMAIMYALFWIADKLRAQIQDDTVIIGKK